MKELGDLVNRYKDLINRYNKTLDLTEKRCQINEAMCDLYRKRVGVYESTMSDMLKLIKGTENVDLIESALRITEHLLDLDQTYIQMGKSYLDKAEKEALDEEED